MYIIISVNCNTCDVFCQALFITIKIKKPPVGAVKYGGETKR